MTESASWPVRAVRFLAGAAALTVAVFASTAAMPAGAAQHPAPGDAARRTSLVPAWIHIAAGGNHTCGIREGNTLWCWGQAAAGELGTGQTTNQDLPQQIAHPTAGWTSVTAGQEHSCALRSDGTLWCWGENTAGQVGIGSTTNVARPQQVTSPASTGWASVAAGWWHTCARRADGTLWCWGFNGYGQAGIGNTTDQDLPQQVTTPASTGWTSVGASVGHTCATRTHTLWCWGANSTGQLGIGNTTDQHLPRQVQQPSRTGWSLIALGESHTCATQPGHTLWCWGFNRWGQLGIGNFVQQDLAQQVTS